MHSSHQYAGNSLVLGIETSCDETAAAVVADGRDVRANVIASQVATHALYGGVVPEIASREHLRQIAPVVREALLRADTTLDDICAVAVTEGPGLAGALFVGIAYAKALAFAANKPLIAVNHLEGHIHSALMAAEETTAAAATLALVVSGGHTHLYLAEDGDAGWRYKNVGRTVDDAAGEAFDKAAKMLGLGYPGGPWISSLAEHGNPRAVPFSFTQVKTKGRGRGGSDGANDFLFSFSGIKTAVARYLELHDMVASSEKRRRAIADNPNMTPEQMLSLCNAQALGLAASFQHAVVEDLVRKTLRAVERFHTRRLLVTGGVAANLQLRKRFSQEAAARGLSLSFPAAGLSTDNAAMIAAAAWPKFLTGNFAAPELTAQPSLKL